MSDGHSKTMSITRLFAQTVRDRAAVDHEFAIALANEACEELEKFRTALMIIVGATCDPDDAPDNEVVEHVSRVARAALEIDRSMTDERESDKCECGQNMPRSVICVELEHLPDGSLQRVREWIEIDE